jgi:hypothetical protein
MLPAVFAFFHRFATGEIDSQGIHYRRYIFCKLTLAGHPRDSVERKPLNFHSQRQKYSGSEA